MATGLRLDFSNLGLATGPMACSPMSPLRRTASCGSWMNEAMGDRAEAPQVSETELHAFYAR